MRVSEKVVLLLGSIKNQTTHISNLEHNLHYAKLELAKNEEALRAILGKYVPATEEVTL